MGRVSGPPVPKNTGEMNGSMIVAAAGVQDSVDQETVAAIASLVVEHAHCLDHGEAGRLWELYTEDGSLVVPPELGIGGSVHGREALQEWSRARAAKQLRTLHTCTNLRVYPLEDGEVGATCAAVVYRCTEPEDAEATIRSVLPALVSEYVDVCRREKDGRWRFASRLARPLFIGEELSALAAGQATARAEEEE